MNETEKDTVVALEDTDRDAEQVRQDEADAEWAAEEAAQEQEEREREVRFEERREAAEEARHFAIADDYQDNWLDDCRFGMVGE